MGRARANRQFRLGRHHLDVCGWAHRRRQRALAGRGRDAEPAAMAGRRPGGDLVAAAWGPHCHSHRRHHGRSPLCGVRQGMGRPFGAPDVHVPAESGVRIDPAGVCDLRRGAVSAKHAAPAGLCWRGYPVRGHCRRGLGGCAAQTLRRATRQWGRVCEAGLWRWSRHPNYFFEWFGWLAYPVIALSVDYQWGWVTLLAPAFMYWILVCVTGIPPLEAQMLRSRGDRYRAYQSRTSVFFPLPPQKEVVT